ncbi:SMP-30/gluconolactonase/LRE family protein [Stutzerimonas stutzeri]|uniref:SMP-30/gluconolactonase/LRE family protein n=1 Tax=Stutzerimonas stutzeri TaxID=316 RepID=UPI00210EF7E8|nr:SMP-30/gluconolactonase/LRE family protein [Stutzerimonas stutzeri]MCQ4260669.1 SMP-30/gluconolactonase/LRE family protein [Stutzerimonas stutzeri]
MQWLPISQQRYILAEGPFWDAPDQTLYWADIVGRLACRMGTDGYRQWQLTEPVSAFIPCKSGDALVTLSSGVYRLDLQATETNLKRFCVADATPGNRANEARCDAQGRLWLGTMQNNIDDDGSDLPITRRSGGLFRIDQDGSVMQLLSDLGIVNTLLWSEAGDRVICGDTLDESLFIHEIADAGHLTRRDTWAGPHPRGVPDGSAMDAEGYVWNARWGGHCLLRFAPDGCLDRVVELPVSHPTSCVFGGPNLTHLYVTSARPGEAATALDGAVLMADVGVVGLPCTRFAG